MRARKDSQRQGKAGRLRAIADWEVGTGGVKSRDWGLLMRRRLFRTRVSICGLSVVSG